MVESIKTLFADNMAGLSFLAVFLISMLPICEARIGIPFGMATEIWGVDTLSPAMAFFAGFLGSSLSSALVLICLKPLFKKLKQNKTFKNLISKYESKFQKNASDVINDKEVTKHKRWNSWLSVMIFVAMPAPLTGIWMGSGIAAYTEMNFWESFSSVVVGNLIACLIIVFVCTIFKNSVLFILIVSLEMIVLYLTYNAIYKHLQKKKKKKKTANNTEQ